MWRATKPKERDHMSNCTLHTRQPAALRPLANIELDAVSGGLISASVSDGAFRAALGPVGFAIGDQRGYVMNGIRAGLLGALLHG
jgi:hypothetical protein